MISPSIASLIEEGDPLTPSDWDEEKEQIWREHRALVRQQCVEVYSSIPCWQERAKKNPNFWKEFSLGRARLLSPDSSGNYFPPQLLKTPTD